MRASTKRYTIISQSRNGTDYQSAFADTAAGIERAIAAIRRTPGGYCNGVDVMDRDGTFVRVCHRHGPDGRIERLDGSECGAPDVEF